MDFHLVVVRPFGPYAAGAVVRDAAAMQEILLGEHMHHVVRVSNAAQGG